MQTSVTITRISRKQKTSASGRPYTSLGLQTQEHGEQWLSGFGNKDNADWKAGDTVEIIVEKKGDYLNFSMPTRISTPAPQGPGNGEIKNFLEFKILPELTKIHARLDSIDAILRADPSTLELGAEDSPFNDFK